MVKKKMVRKSLFLLIATLIVIAIANMLWSENANSLVLSYSQKESVVNKTPGEDFSVEIKFENIGTNKGQWNTNIAFESEFWFYAGVPQILELESGKSQTLEWEGIVPEDANFDSVARLVVYYNDSFETLEWWIHVVPSAELSIKSSKVK
jgi:hypothetical protein